MLMVTKNFFALSEGDAEPPTGAQAASSPRDTADQDRW
jgi:hypothetical protein